MIETLKRGLAAFAERVVVVANAKVTYMLLASLGVSAASAEIAEAVPVLEGLAAQVVVLGVTAWAVVVGVVRRVTEAIPADRGLISRIDWEAEIGELAESLAAVDDSDTGDEGV